MLKLIVLVAVGATVATASFADDTPDYLYHMDRIEKAVNFAYNAEMCAKINFKIVGEAIDPIKTAVAEGAKGGVTSSFGMTQASAAMERRKEDETLIAQEAGHTLARAFNKEDVDAAATALNDFYDYYNDKCQSFADSEQFEDNITAPVDDEDRMAGFEKFIDFLRPDTAK